MQFKLEGFDKIDHKIIRSKSHNVRRETFIDDDTGEEVIVEYISDKSYLYILRNSIGLVKIGKSVNPELRRKTIEFASGIKIEIVNKIKDAEWYEIKLHKYYSEYRGIGEWFNLPLKEFEWLRTLSLAELENIF